MTPREMSTRYLHSLGRRIEGEKGEIAPLMPILILDLQYQIYNHKFTQKKLKEQGYKHDVIKWSGYWLDAYNKVNKPFFGVFNDDEKDEIGDIMDALATRTNTTIVQIRCAYRKLLEDSENVELDTDLLTCNLLIKLARSYWKKVYITARGKGEINPHLENLLNSQTAFMDKISPTKTEIYQDEIPDLSVLIDKLCKEVVDFCFEQDKI